MPSITFTVRNFHLLPSISFITNRFASNSTEHFAYKNVLSRQIISLILRFSPSWMRTQSNQIINRGSINSCNRFYDHHIDVCGAVDH
jgi:hypothetical protein